MIAGVFASYVHLQTSIGKSRSNINNLKEQITVLKADNSAMKNRIATSLNLNSIKEKAMTQLGMVYADTDQIVYYNMPDDDYMNQIEPVK
jgi:cell division protein FtsB